MSNKGIAIGVVVALATAGAAYGVGRFQGNVRVADAEQRANAATSASASAMALSSVATDIERGKVARLEGRRRLHLAIIALDDRNFGIAQDHLTAARAHFGSAKGKDPELDKLGTEIEAFKIVATDDVGEQRKKVLEWAKRLDELMPPAKP